MGKEKKMWIILVFRAKTGYFFNNQIQMEPIIQEDSIWLEVRLNIYQESVNDLKKKDSAALKCELK